MSFKDVPAHMSNNWEWSICSVRQHHTSAAVNSQFKSNYIHFTVLNGLNFLGIKQRCVHVLYTYNCWNSAACSDQHNYSTAVTIVCTYTVQTIRIIVNCRICRYYSNLITAETVTSWHHSLDSNLQTLDQQIPIADQLHTYYILNISHTISGKSKITNMIIAQYNMIIVKYCKNKFKQNLMHSKLQNSSNNCRA